MSNVAVDGAALYSGPPNHPNEHAWMAARDKLASSVSVQADAYTVHSTINTELVVFVVPTALIPLPILCRPRISMAP